MIEISWVPKGNLNVGWMSNTTAVLGADHAAAGGWDSAQCREIQL